VKIAALRLEIEVERGRDCTFAPELVSSEHARERAEKRRPDILADAKERDAAARRALPDPEAGERDELAKRHRARAVPRVSGEIAGFMKPFMQHSQRSKSVERTRQ
jgi:hypothetical protein